MEAWTIQFLMRWIRLLFTQDSWNPFDHSKYIKKKKKRITSIKVIMDNFGMEVTEMVTI